VRQYYTSILQEKRANTRGETKKIASLVQPDEDEEDKDGLEETVDDNPAEIAPSEDEDVPMADAVPAETEATKDQPLQNLNIPQDSEGETYGNIKGGYADERNPIQFAVSALYAHSSPF